MSLRFEVDGNELRIVQRRRGLKILMWIFLVGSVAGIVIVPLVNRLPHTGRLTCDRAAGTCSITYEPTHDVSEIKLAAITGARIASDNDSVAAILDRPDSKLKHQWVCQAPKSSPDAKAVEAAGAEISVFFVTGKGQTLDVTCPNHGGEFNAWMLVPAVAVGDLILLALMLYWLQIAHTVVDKAARRVTMRGRSGLRTKWNVDRPLSDVVGVSLEKRYVMRGNYRHLVYVHFNNGEKVLAMAPAFYKLPTLESRTAELRKFLGL